jgi:23S rRNA (cytidine2498-2'-O)-methyltransferase
MDSCLRLKKLPPNFDVVIPFLRFEKELENELLLSKSEIYTKNSKIYLVSNLKAKPVWAQDWWPQTKKFNFATKSEALKILKAQKNRGVYYASADLPLAASLRKELRELKLRRIDYEVPSKFDFKYFTWTMLDNTQLLVCESPASQFPIGWHEFNEDKDSPPNRAYLKLWEVLTLGSAKINSQDVAIDLGSSPGGWTWVLSQQVKKVYSIDKAPLDKKISAKSNVVYSSEDAFQVNPKDFPDCTFLFSDIICTPERLLELVKNWLENSKVRNYVCTIKFKGPADFEIMKQFEKIENSKIIHLYHNKNEVTWIKQGSSS